MAKPATTKVVGSIRNALGKPYEGALVKVYLSAPMVVTDNTVGTELISVFTNSYGKFEINLVPTESSEKNSEIYYTFEIIKENTQYYKKIVPKNDYAIDFEDLPDYVPFGKRPIYIGRDPSGTAPTQIPVDLTGIFKWTVFDGDGITVEFVAPGEIALVSLNGVLLLENIDYEKTKFNTVRLDEAPNSGDIIGIQYRI